MEITLSQDGTSSNGPGLPWLPGDYSFDPASGRISSAGEVVEFEFSPGITLGINRFIMIYNMYCPRNGLSQFWDDL